MAKTPSETPVATKPVIESSMASASTNTTSAVTSNTSTEAAVVEKFTEANFAANYASNPKPEYPATAKSREWQGKVVLRVQVSAEGLSNGIKVEKSSGYDMLDESAIAAVKHWRFIPAKRGETAVASSVLVPIDFSLMD